MELKELVEESHKIAKSKGFWDRNNIPEKLMLIVTEIGEACEADRTSDFDNFKEEIADTFIRLADLCGYLGIDIEKEIEIKTAINRKRPKKHNKRY